MADVYGVADARFQSNVDAFLDAVIGKADFSPVTDREAEQFQAKSARGRRDDVRRNLRSRQDRPLRFGRTPEQPIRGSFSQATLARQAVFLALAPFVDPEFSSPHTEHPVLTFLLEKEG